MKHKMRNQIVELRQMVTELRPVDDIREQAKRIRNSCAEVKATLEEYSISLSALPLIIGTAEAIMKEGYNADDIQNTIELCDQMVDLDNAVQKKLVELEKKIASMGLNQKKQVEMAREALKKLEEEEKIARKVREKVF